MADIVPTLFGLTPEMYQQSQQARADAQALQYAQLTPFQQANYAIGRGANMLGGAIGRGLGGEDPELARITMRQQIAGQLDPNNLESFNRGIEILRQSGDGQGALMLQMEANKYKQQAQERQLTTLKTEDYLTQRGRDMQTRGLEQVASELVATMKKPDGTLDQDVINKLRSFPQGIAAITAQAKIIPDLRRLGATATPEVDPFTPFITDETIPKNVQTYAKQLSKSFADGILDPEKVDAKFKELAEMAQRALQFESNQAQIKAQQEQSNSFRDQGLANSRAALALATSTKNLQEQNAKYERDRKEEERKNKPLPINLSKPEEEDFDIAKDATNLATDAYNYISRVKLGEIKFSLKDRASIATRRAFGSEDADVVARDEYDKFIKRLTNETLRLNKGVQTDFDYKNALAEIKTSESASVVANTLNKLVELNLRRVQNANDAILRRRENAGFGPPPVGVSVPKFTIQIVTQEDYNRFLANPKYPSGTIFINAKGEEMAKP